MRIQEETITATKEEYLDRIIKAARQNNNEKEKEVLPGRPRYECQNYDNHLGHHPPLLPPFKFLIIRILRIARRID